MDASRTCLCKPVCASPREPAPKLGGLVRYIWPHSALQSSDSCENTRRLHVLLCAPNSARPNAARCLSTPLFGCPHPIDSLRRTPRAAPRARTQGKVHRQPKCQATNPWAQRPPDRRQLLRWWRLCPPHTRSQIACARARTRRRPVDEDRLQAVLSVGAPPRCGNHPPRPPGPTRSQSNTASTPLYLQSSSAACASLPVSFVWPLVTPAGARLVSLIPPQPLPLPLSFS